MSESAIVNIILAEVVIYFLIIFISWRLFKKDKIKFKTAQAVESLTGLVCLFIFICCICAFYVSSVGGEPSDLIILGRRIFDGSFFN